MGCLAWNIEYGTAELKTVSLGIPDAIKSIKKADARAGESKVSAGLRISGEIAEVTFKKPVKLAENETLTITLY